MASRRENERRRLGPGGGGGSGTARSAALEQLRSIKEQGGRRIDSFQLKEEKKIYETLSEQDYAALVAKRRLEAKSFVVGEDALGYGDIGEEENWEIGGLPSSSDEEGAPKQKKPAESRKRDVPRKSERELKAAAALMGKQNVSNMFVAASFSTGVAKDTNDEVDNVLSDVLASVGSGVANRDRRKQRRLDAVAAAREVPRAGAIRPVPSAIPAAAREVTRPEKVDDQAVQDSSQSPEKALSAIEAIPAAAREVTRPEKVDAQAVQNSSESPEKASSAIVYANFMEAMEASIPPITEEKPVTEDMASARPLPSNGKVQFFLLDAYEEPFGGNAGRVFLFGKVRRDGKYASCCVAVGNIQRCLYVVPAPSVFPENAISCLQQETQADAVQQKLQELFKDLKMELAEKLMDMDVASFSMAPVKRLCAFDGLDMARGANYYMKLCYPYKDPPVPGDTKGNHFTAIYGTHTSALELFLLKRKIKGPCWLEVTNASECQSPTQISWCKLELSVNSPKDVTVAAPGSCPSEFPKLIVASLNLKTVINQKQNVNEIVSASVVFCEQVKVDVPMPQAEWNNRKMLRHFTIIRKLEGGVYPIGFDSEVKKRNQEAGHVVLTHESSERALLNLLMLKLYQLDPDVLVGHNISAFDLDVLLHRLQVCKVPNSLWSTIGRLKRSQMPRLGGRGTAFGGGASIGVMTCVAGRLLCDTYLSSRELLKEVSYTLTQLAKTQLGRDRKEIAPMDVPNMYQSAAALLGLVEAAETDAWLSLNLMFHLSVLPLTRQLTNISGNLWSKTLQGARAQRVEYLLLHEFCSRKFILPDKLTKNEKEQQIKKKRKAKPETDNLTGDQEETEKDATATRKGPSYMGGLVLEPKKGLYDKYILLLDFNSLYPSIIQEYNICFTTVERPADDSVPPLPTTDTPGVLPQVLRSLVERRKQVKQWLKRTTDAMKFQQLDIQQQALKLTANSMYGCLGFPNSRFYAKAIAELITSQGPEIL